MSMRQMAVQVESLSLFLLLAIGASVTAVGEGSEGLRIEFTGHSSLSFTNSMNK